MTFRSTNALIPAPMWRRLLAATVDAAVIILGGYYAALYWGEDLPDGGRGWQGLEALLAVLVFAAYWVLTDWAVGATIGKLLLSLRVISLDGSDCSFMQSLKRNILRLVDVQFFYLVGYLVARFNANRQRLGDLWAGTIVVTAATLRKL